MGEIYEKVILKMAANLARDTGMELLQARNVIECLGISIGGRELPGLIEIVVEALTPPLIEKR